jgi:hypothetical protein
MIGVGHHRLRPIGPFDCRPRGRGPEVEQLQGFLHCLGLLHGYRGRPPLLLRWFALVTWFSLRPLFLAPLLAFAFLLTSLPLAEYGSKSSPGRQIAGSLA